MRGTHTAGDGDGSHDRAQANLAALVVALVVLTAVTVLSVGVAEDALAGQQRETEQRRVAAALADRLVGPGAPVTDRANVLNASAVARFDAAALRRAYPAVRTAEAVRVRLGDRTVAATGRPTGGASVRRLVLVQRVESRRIEPAFTGGNALTLPRRTPRARIALTPGSARVETVRANGRVVLHDPDGLRGEFTVALPRRETVRLLFVANESLDRGDAAVTLFPRETTKRTLEVTVDA